MFDLFQAIYMDFKKIALLLIFFIFYVTIGGMIFMMLEAPLEQTMRSEIEKVLYDFRGEIILLNHSNQLSNFSIETFL